MTQEKELKVTLTRVLEAATACPQSKATLERLFPEAFAPKGLVEELKLLGANRLLFTAVKSPGGGGVRLQEIVPFLGGRPDTRGNSTVWCNLNHTSEFFLAATRVAIQHADRELSLDKLLRKMPGWP